MSDNLRDALEKLANEMADRSGIAEADEASSAYAEAVDSMRDLLAAHPAEPALVASRERVTEVLRAHQEDSVVDCICGWRDDANDEDLFGHQVLALLAAGVFRDAPTRAQVEEAVSAAWLDPQAGSGAVVDAVLAMINGG